ncbi:MAG: hypothetical protein B7Z80_06910 [Rhodospirillales bacterium 20-64-7]|nr:MAG: hypothetical protein B7Z80_06910 [Rhodospirillales bacterium 20-64-7]HQT77196.1 hypothetical protein [Rhodopila sp.]
MSILRRFGAVTFAAGVAVSFIAINATPARAWFTGASGGVMPPVMAAPPVYTPPPSMHAAPTVRMPPNYAMPPNGALSPAYGMPPNSATLSGGFAPSGMSASPLRSSGLPNAEPPSPPSYTVAPGIWVPPHWQGPYWVPGHPS